MNDSSGQPSIRKYLGKYGEYRVLSKLLELEIEGYLAIKQNQADYDITAIPHRNKVIRIQVKTTFLGNKSTNNLVGTIDRNFDFLVIVVIREADCVDFFVLSKKEALKIKGDSKNLGVSMRVKKQFVVKPEIAIYQNKWGKLKKAT